MPQTTKHTDEELVKGCTKNDRYYQEMLYRKYFRSMMRMCLRYTQDREVAMEIVNNGFLRVFKKIEKYTAKGALEGWIRKLVFHALSDYFKSNSRSIHFLELEDRDAARTTSALDHLYFEDLLDLVDQLPDATRRVFYLYAIEGYSHREIAEMNSISIGTSKWHLSAARKLLQQLIAKRNNIKQHAG